MGCFLATQQSGADCWVETAITEGNYSDHVTKGFLERVCLLLSSMPCWDPKEAQKPWSSIVKYHVRPVDLEYSRERPSLPPGCTAAVTVDPSGDVSSLELTETLDQARVRFAAPDHPTTSYLLVDVRLLKRVEGKFFLRRGAGYRQLSVHCRKQLTYVSRFRWTYRLSLIYRHPYVEHKAFIEEEQEHRDLVFWDPPLSSVVVLCHSSGAVQDVQYLVQSWLCKIRDLVPQGYVETGEEGGTGESKAVDGDGDVEPIDAEPRAATEEDDSGAAEEMEDMEDRSEDMDEED